MACFERALTTIDSHTAGECTRLVTSGLQRIKGQTMAEKLEYLAQHMAWVPGLLMLEPRGHRDMYGAVLTEPCDSRADAGVIFMDNQVYEPMCGHGVIGVVTSLLETGMLRMVSPTSTVVLDTAAGLVRAWAQIEEGHVASVTFENSPAFVFAQDVSLDVPDLGKLQIDIAFGGNFFVLLNAAQLGLTLEPHEAGRLAVLGMRILEAANRQVSVRHPELPHIQEIIDLRFYVEPGSEGADSRNVVVLGDHMIDRSPCGTGTCAELALRHARGHLSAGQPWITESIIGTRFTGEIVAETEVGSGADARPAIVPRITGIAHVTGVHEFLLDRRDPFPRGFALGLADPAAS